MKTKVVVKKKLVDMEEWKPSEYWKRFTHILMTSARYQNAYIMTTNQCSVYIIKAVKSDMNSCIRDCEAMTSKKETTQVFWLYQYAVYTFEQGPRLYSES